MKKCQFCSTDREEEFYPKRKTSCKKCINERRREKSKSKEAKELKRVADKKYYSKNKDKIKEARRLYHQQNKKKINNKRREKTRTEEYREYRRDYLKRYRKRNLNYRLSESLRTRLNRAISGNYKSGSAVSDLGCTINEFKKYLEAQFQPGMNWENWGVNGWHIDHIKPLSSFDLTVNEELKKACHYTNLQPLWAKDNIIKGCE